MGKRTVADTIKEITRRHLQENNGLLLGQAVTAVGWVNGTVPDVRGIVELPMTDVAGAGFAVGAAMVGRRPIFVLRFQDFLTLNGSPLINYAAKSKDLHGKSTPIFIRAIATEGLGPVHSSVLHSICMHFPGFRVCAPMTSMEYEECWQEFMDNDDPMFVSEHKDSFKHCEEFSDVIIKHADITLFVISSPRFSAEEAANLLNKEGIRCNIVHIVHLKPFEITNRYLEPLSNSKLGLVIDSGFELCGASRSIAYELSDHSGYPVKALGLMDKTKCLCPPHQNKAPDSGRICEAVQKIVRKRLH